MKNKKHEPLIMNQEMVKKLLESGVDVFATSVNTMARRKLKRKVFLYDINTGTESKTALNFDDLQVGDIFCMYECNGEPVIIEGKHKIMKVDRIDVKRRDRSDIKLHVLPMII